MDVVTAEHNIRINGRKKLRAQYPDQMDVVTAEHNIRINGRSNR